MNLQTIAAAISRRGASVEPMAVAPLRFTNTGDSEATIAFNDVKSAGTVLSIRRGEKKKFAAWDFSAVTLQPGEYMEVVGDTTAATQFIGRFVMTGTVSASGSIMSIIYGESLTEEQNLVMPHNKLIFYEGSPDSIFYNCTSLITAPELPATTLVESCYRNLFYGCANLTAAPELPAVSLMSYCYLGMFIGCVSLTTAPELPAGNLSSYCYTSMFEGCSNLATVSVRFFNWTETLYTYNWLLGVAAHGTFTCPSNLPVTDRDESHIPAGWTIINYNS